MECTQWTAARCRLKIQIAMNVCKSGDNPLGAKNNDNRLWSGASAFLKSVYFRAFQISGVAALVSFLLAIITILVSSDNENIRKLKSRMKYIIKSLVMNNLVCSS